MKPIKAIKDFSLDGVIYENGDEVEVKDIETLVKLNEKGFISPFTGKEIQKFAKEFKKEE